MARLGNSQRPIIMPTYPHFLAADTDVWTRYLADPVAPITEVWYDVHVGLPVSVGDDAGDMEKRIAFGITRKRIDVVAKIRQGYWVIEVKPIAGMTALGQILAYTNLFINEYDLDGEVWPVIIADEVDKDVIGQFEALGVVVILT